MTPIQAYIFGLSIGVALGVNVTALVLVLL